ncbi:hypothetical protein PAXRUDRAFT_374558 [Paxillus rubicundulus Ve08.2h10]|uniref:RING-type domain-containing protein n=1 Tax=Paxillus rubicundulus Ve08.2h10 TaxID=930991 RepID=A0A0D0E997_9AGAM|nr:hypothetical protein PAXRUDRAFT_374558 [Paxillus rubicundulus Ve08.2h10]
MAQNAAHEAVVIDMGVVGGTTNKKDNKQETLFGPNIGVNNTAPKWAQSMGKQAAAENLSSDTIKAWIAKSKEPSHPTTTLQALVNLKRPTLRLVPLAMAPGDDPEHADSYHHHGLEFQYDCDAPKCRIDVHVILPADHPLSENVDSNGFSRILVFESVVEGGFGKVLKLEEGATLELGRFEQSSLPDESLSREKAVTDSPPEGPEAPSSTIARSSRARKRFTAFNFRKRNTDRAASGPALTVIDAEAANGEKEKEVKDDLQDGVRVTIRLSALDEDGLGVATVNEQMTYLHVVRLGVTPTGDEEDARPWVVQVIKREATIGPHTFHLHEIYGLSSQSTQPQVAPTTPTDDHTYPPTSTTAAAPVREDEPSSECLLCLSSPREVILLPCRHLVACKECAINMVEFGAGGNIVHSEDSNVATNAGMAGAGDGGANANTSGSAEAASVPIVVPPNPRRKRKAKGWFCPVCRQPYTSLLRISTTPPTKDISDDENRASTSTSEPDHEGGSEHEHDGNEDEDDNHDANTTTVTNDPLPATAVTTTLAPAPGGMMNTLRSSLRRNLVLSSPRNESESVPRDVERGMEVPTVVV